MAKHAPTPADIANVEVDLWNTVRALEAIGRDAGEIAIATNGRVNAQAEGIAGIAALAVTQIRCLQVTLGGEK